MLGELVAKLHIAAELFELAVRTMAVGTLILCAHDAGEAFLAEPVYAIDLHRAVAAALQTDVGLAAVLVHLARNDVHDPTHRIAAVQEAGRTADNLDLLRHYSLISIGNRMSHEPGVLRLPIYQY